MSIKIMPSDLMYKYRRQKETRDQPKFTGKPDPHPFDRDDLYEVIPMFEAVLTAVGSSDGAVLNRLEEILDRDVPRFIASREGVYDCLVAVMGDILAAHRQEETSG